MTKVLAYFILGSAFLLSLSPVASANTGDRCENGGIEFQCVQCAPFWPDWACDRYGQECFVNVFGGCVPPPGDIEISNVDAQA